MTQKSCNFTLIITILLFNLSIVNLLFITWHYYMKGGQRSPTVVSAFRAHDFPENLFHDELPAVYMTDEESVHYSPLGRASDAQWFELSGFDTGSGYIRLGPNDRIFAVTMFHELHCLRILNGAFTKEPFAKPEHIHHCLNYIRQTTLCYADTTLEPGNFEDRDFEKQRAGATHKCRDWSLAYPVMEKNYLWWKAQPGSVAEK